MNGSLRTEPYFQESIKQCEIYSYTIIIFLSSFLTLYKIESIKSEQNWSVDGHFSFCTAWITSRARHFVKVQVGQATGFNPRAHFSSVIYIGYLYTNNYNILLLYAYYARYRYREVSIYCSKSQSAANIR